MALVIDTHMHVDTAPEVGWNSTAEDCLSRMAEAGIDAAVIMSIRDVPGPSSEPVAIISGACKQYPDQLFGFIRLDPNYRQEAEALLRKSVTTGYFRGLKLHPVSTRAHPSGEATINLLHVAGEIGVPTLFHCADEPMTTPLSIAPAARNCPESTIILGHMGGYFHVDEAISVAEEFPNVFLETAGMPYPGKIKEAAERIGAHRILFGSDGPGACPLLEREKVELARLSTGELRMVLGGNAAKLLNKPGGHPARTGHGETSGTQSLQPDL